MIARASRTLVALSILTFLAAPLRAQQTGMPPTNVFATWTGTPGAVNAVAIKFVAPPTVLPLGPMFRIYASIGATQDPRMGRWFAVTTTNTNGAILSLPPLGLNAPTTCSFYVVTLRVDPSAPDILESGPSVVAIAPFGNGGMPPPQISGRATDAAFPEPVAESSATTNPSGLVGVSTHDRRFWRFVAATRSP